MSNNNDPYEDKGSFTHSGLSHSGEAIHSSISLGDDLIRVEELVASDFEQVVTLWASVEGVRVLEANSLDKFTSYLLRNPRLSSVARLGSHVIGAVLVGHDGLFGYLHHMAVDPRYRGLGVARSIVARSLSLLASEGISTCRLIVSERNPIGRPFWRSMGWNERDDATAMWIDLRDPR